MASWRMATGEGDGSDGRARSSEAGMGVPWCPRREGPLERRLQVPGPA